MKPEDLIYRDEAYKINGACMEVYKRLGNGFLEAVYQECLELEFGVRGLPFIAQHPYGARLSRTTVKTNFQAGLYLLRQDHRRDQSRLEAR